MFVLSGLAKAEAQTPEQQINKLITIYNFIPNSPKLKAGWNISALLRNYAMTRWLHPRGGEFFFLGTNNKEWNQSLGAESNWSFPQGCHDFQFSFSF